jgi:CBS domain-containing protein
MLVKDVMTTDVVTVLPETDVREIARTMVERRISAVPVVDQSGKLAGIVSEGDLMRRAESGTERTRSWWLRAFGDENEEARDYIKAHGRHARDVMTPEVVTVTEDMPIAEVAGILERARIKRVPVLREGKVVGIVSRANLLHGLATYMSTASPVEGDQALRQSVLDAIAEIGIGHHFINVIVHEGSVELWGTVWTEDERRAVIVAVESVAGVSKIENHIVVLPATIGGLGWS